MSPRSMGSHQSAAALSVDWLTPPSIIDALGGAGSFDLDPCASSVRRWPTAKAALTPAENGLAFDWWGRVWLNPPYTRDAVGAWLARLAAHGRGTALIFARTETDAFARHVFGAASGLLFLRGRLHFHRASDGLATRANAGAPSVLCAYGPDDLDRLASAPLDGALVPLRLGRSTVVLALGETWRASLLAWARGRSGPIELADAYKALSRDPKARRNANWRAKVRQTIQRAGFERVGPCQWRAPAAPTNPPQGGDGT